MYVLYAREFGWTPDQVDSLPMAVEPWIFPIHDAIESDRARRREQAAAAAAEKGKHRKR